MAVVRIGLEVLVEEQCDRLRHARLGLLLNQASVDYRFRSAADVVAAAFPGQLRFLFSPQHGFWGEQQANMIESADTRYGKLSLPVYSLYSKTRRPAPELLRSIDVLLIDLQDTGTRVYTFVWTLLECLREAANCGTRVVILDRPNPLGGATAEGPSIAPGYESFVGGAAIPMRHGLTLGELALLLNTELQLGAQVEVVAMQGWNRGQFWPETGRVWTPPSPNMPRWETAAVYPGQVLLEGVNLSEGRGTTRPFEFCGAPWVDAEQLVEELGAESFPGLVLQPMRFRPTFDKWAGEICGGAALHVTAPQEVRSFAFTIQLLLTVHRLYPGQLRLLEPPYEYERVRPPLDILYGSEMLRHALQANPGNLPPAAPEVLSAFDDVTWWQRAAGSLLYPRP